MSSFISPTLLWLIIGIVLIIAEIFLPGAVIGILGFSALIVSGLTWLGLLSSFIWQIVIFLILSATLTFLFLKFLKNILYRTDSGSSNDYIEIGKIVPVIETINSKTGKGKVRYMGSLWKAAADIDIDEGETVTIIGSDNLTLLVEKNHKKESTL